MFQGFFRGFKGCFNGVSGVFKGVKRVFQGCLRDVSIVIEGYFKGVSSERV